MKTSSCKAKGRRAAAEARELLLAYATALEPADIIITSSGETGEDLKISPAGRSIYPFCIECKCVEKLNIWSANEQALSHLASDDERIPLVCYKRNHSELYVSLKFSDFLWLVTSRTSSTPT